MSLPKIIESLTKNFSSRFGRKVVASVIHTTESPDTSLWGIVQYFKANGAPSAHYVIDALPVRPDSEFVQVVRCVPEKEKAWTALSANAVTVNYELIGRASRTRQDWLTKYKAQLRTAAALCAQDSLQYGFPVRHAVPGIVGHVDLSRYGFPQSHTDPGRGFPWDVFLDMVKEYKGKIGKPIISTTKVPPKGRPKSAPWPTPLWAFRLHKWLLTEPEKRGKRPKAPIPVPRWFWEWRSRRRELEPSRGRRRWRG